MIVNQIDKYFRDQLQSTSRPVSPDAWHVLEGQLKQRKPKVPYLLWGIAASLTLIMVVLSQIDWIDPPVLAEKGVAPENPTLVQKDNVPALAQQVVEEKERMVPDELTPGPARANIPEPAESLTLVARKPSSLGLAELPGMTLASSRTTPALVISYKPGVKEEPSNFRKFIGKASQTRVLASIREMKDQVLTLDRKPEKTKSDI